MTILLVVIFFLTNGYIEKCRKNPFNMIRYFESMDVTIRDKKKRIYFLYISDVTLNIKRNEYRDFFCHESRDILRSLGTTLKELQPRFEDVLLGN